MRFVPFAALAAIAAGTIAAAQAPQAGPAGARPDRTERWQEHKAEFEAMREHRADDIALLIGLRADQRPAFDAMMAAMEPPHRGPGGGPDGDKPPMAPGGPAESMAARFDHMQARVDERAAAARARLAALKSFYAGLTPDQRLRFDALDRLRHDHDRMAMRGGHGHGGRDGPSGPPPVG